MAWIKLVKGNDWGAEFYTTAEERSARAKPRHASWSAGTLVRVRWPNGAETIEHLIALDYRNTIGDHGHDYVASGKIPALQCWLNGADVIVKLEQVAVWDEEWPCL